MTNLLDNAVKYGDYGRIKTKLGAEHIVVRIRDGGQGIPDALMEKVFAPFFAWKDRARVKPAAPYFCITIRKVAYKPCWNCP